VRGGDQHCGDVAHRRRDHFRHRFGVLQVESVQSQDRHGCSPGEKIKIFLKQFNDTSASSVAFLVQLTAESKDYWVYRDSKFIPTAHVEKLAQHSWIV
jgi:hypothetical protein